MFARNAGAVRMALAQDARRKSRGWPWAREREALAAIAGQRMAALERAEALTAALARSRTMRDASCGHGARAGGCAVILLNHYRVGENGGCTDNNVWDFLFERKLELAIELPRDEYCLLMTREAEFEISPIPVEKAELRGFIEKTIKDCGIETRLSFGFYDEGHPPDEQRVGGFDVGYWASKEELAFIEQQKTRLGSDKKPTTRLFKNEADIALAARSFHSVVLSLDKKKGPLKGAYEQGGKVIFLTDFESSGMSDADREALAKITDPEKRAAYRRLIAANPGILSHRARPKNYSDETWLAAVADAKRLAYGGWK